MKIEVKVDVTTNKYGPTLATAELSLDSDVVDKDSVAVLITGVVKTAIDRANAKLNTEEAKQPKQPIEVAIETPV